jgi:hypothetical protein
LNYPISGRPARWRGRAYEHAELNTIELIASSKGNAARSINPDQREPRRLGDAVMPLLIPSSRTSKNRMWIVIRSAHTSSASRAS